MIGWEKWKCSICGKDANIIVLGVFLCNTHLDQKEGYKKKDKMYAEFEEKRENARV